jgi:hypothetical protein
VAEGKPAGAATSPSGRRFVRGFGRGRYLDLKDFDRHVKEHGIPEEDYPAALAQWIAEPTRGPVPRFEKVEETDEQD